MGNVSGWPISRAAINAMRSTRGGDLTDGLILDAVRNHPALDGQFYLGQPRLRGTARVLASAGSIRRVQRWRHRGRASAVPGSLSQGIPHSLRFL